MTKNENQLGTFLMSRRKRVDPLAIGLSGKRRTSGLRREEVAQRANISTTWYTWLEQGRGGAPSSRVLESICEALLLTEAEREHAFLIGKGQAPKSKKSTVTSISHRLQRLIDALSDIPAIVVSAEWDVIAWNKAACVVLNDYTSMSVNERNVLRRMFLDKRMKESQQDWDSLARYILATFRAKTTHTSNSERAQELITELSDVSSEFNALWSENNIQRTGEGMKNIIHPLAGAMSFEFSSFSIDGRPDLMLLLYNPTTIKDIRLLKKLLTSNN
ncbi:helix-turn-helix transcriptional regulator [Pseudoalteromonas mariniglutinosa]|uniref:helix-turn-helix transcriptional regulator n=1 Tax=Pseudoalteromonas mariniglutinosa TaxID=206042 RepID=UPI00384E92B1